MTCWGVSATRTEWTLLTLNAFVARAPRRAASTVVSPPGFFRHPETSVETSLDAARMSACAT
jgi:hypothetical protein